MTKPTIVIHDIETDIVTEREMNEAEFAQWQLDQDKAAAQVVAQADKEATRQEILNKLGLTMDELKILGL